MNLEKLKKEIGEIIDPTIGKTLEETGGIKHIGYDDTKDLITLIISMGKLGGEQEIMLQRAVARVVKIDNGFKGVRIELEESKIFNSITRKKINFIGVISGKGGVGKSSVAANIAYRLTKKGKKVGMIDADIYGSSLPFLLEIEHQKITYSEDGKIIPIQKNGIELISTYFFTDPNQAVVWRGSMLNSMLSHFFYDVKWNDETEYVIIDFPPGTGDILLDIKAIVPQTQMVLVTTPNLNASLVASKAGQAIKILNHELIGVIENMSYYLDPETHKKHYIFGNGGGAKVANDLNTELIASLEICEPKHHTNLFEIDESNGQIYDEIADYIMMKTQI